MILNTKRAQDKKLVHYRGDYSAFKKMHLQQKATMDKEFKKQQDRRFKWASGFASKLKVKNWIQAELGCRRFHMFAP